MKLVWEK